MNELKFDVVTEAHVGPLLAMARAFHFEDGHPLTPDGEAAVEQIARGAPLVRAWIILEAAQMILDPGVGAVPWGGYQPERVSFMPAAGAGEAAVGGLAGTLLGRD